MCVWGGGGGGAQVRFSLSWGYGCGPITFTLTSSISPDLAASSNCFSTSEPVEGGSSEIENPELQYSTKILAQRKHFFFLTL